jgi:putative DNA primase/helicase
LAGARFVSTSETESGRHLAEVLVKQLTGGDKVTARFLYSEFFEFDAQFKVFLATNHKPVIRGTDNAIWRRIKLIPFEVTIPEKEQDKTLAEKLRAELPGILSWAVRGCLRWQKYGLGQPDKVSAATEAYREEMDVLGGFLKDCCVQKKDSSVRTGQLYQAYKSWSENNGEYALSQHKLAGVLLERGFKPGRTGRRRYWTGLELGDAGDAVSG